MFYQVENPEDRFSCVAAQILKPSRNSKAENGHVTGEMCRIMRKPEFSLCENKFADQLYNIFCSCIGRFVSDLVGSTEDRVFFIAVRMILSQFTDLSQFE